jgi:hypothetical protein
MRLVAQPVEQWQEIAALPARHAHRLGQALAAVGLNFIPLAQQQIEHALIEQRAVARQLTLVEQHECHQRQQQRIFGHGAQPAALRVGNRLDQLLPDRAGLVAIQLAMRHQLAIPGWHKVADLTEREGCDRLNGPAQLGAQRLVECARAAGQGDARPRIELGKLAHHPQHRSPIGVTARCCFDWHLIQAIEQQQRAVAM